MHLNVWLGKYFLTGRYKNQLHASPWMQQLQMQTQELVLLYHKQHGHSDGIVWNSGQLLGNSWLWVPSSLNRHGSFNLGKLNIHSHCKKTLHDYPWESDPQPKSLLTIVFNFCECPICWQTLLHCLCYARLLCTPQATSTPVPSPWVPAAPSSHDDSQLRAQSLSPNTALRGAPHNGFCWRAITPEKRYHNYYKHRRSSSSIKWSLSTSFPTWH